MSETPSPSAPVRAPAEPIPVRAFATVFFTLFLDLVGFGIILPVLPFYAESFGASPLVVTLLSSSFSLAQFVASPMLGRLSDRVGRRPVMLVSIAGACAAMLLLGLAHALWMVFAARIVNGLCNANVSTAHAYVADRVPPHERAKYMGMMGSAIGLGFVVGPAIGGVLHVESMPNLPFYVAAGLGACNWLMAFAWLPESRRTMPASTIGRRGSGSFLREVRVALVGTPLGLIVLINFFFYLVFAAMEFTFALLAQASLGWGAHETGVLFTGLGAVIFVTQGVLVGRIVGRLGEQRTLMLGMLILAAGLTITGNAAVAAAMWIGSAGIAMGNGLISPTVSALVSRASRADAQGLGQGLASSAAALARVFGPLGAGFAFELLGPGMPMRIGAGVLLVVSLPAAWLLGRILARDPST
jgi:DHA1 family tetracycline resistance protein-like MFS transporter